MQNDQQYQEWRKVAARYNRHNLDETYERYLGIFGDDPAPVIWTPEDIEHSNIGRAIREVGRTDYNDFFQWASENRDAFWAYAVTKLGIKFSKNYDEVLDLTNGVEHPHWFPGAALNIVESCLQGVGEQDAIVEGAEDGDALVRTSYRELKEKVERAAGGLANSGLQPGNSVVMYAPMCTESIVCYLALIKMGVVVVSVADSFSPAELKRRAEITGAVAIITAVSYRYGGKELLIYEKVKKAAPEIPAIVFGDKPQLAEGDVSFKELSKASPLPTYHYADPAAVISIFFSSGTTKEPKAIPWTQLVAVKCASDGHFHHDIGSKDVVTWTTGMGWMMAPWLVFAGLLNRATVAVYKGAATGEGFRRFAEEAGVTILGTIPSVVKAWKNQKFHLKANWKVRVFSSTGEPSNPTDYFYLMALAGFTTPIIEYCGGTEIGGGYITGTVVQPASLSAFTTPALGLDFYLLKDDASVAKNGETGEVYIVPPSVGLSQHLLNRDHHREYYEGAPQGPRGEILRRHGDAFETVVRDGTVFYKSVGRTDDAMNLGGIKVSAVELETVLNGHPDIFESAAVSVAPKGGGPERLVVFVVSERKANDPETLKKELQTILNERLNPLFRISEVRLCNHLPRTASNKVMRKELRKEIESR